MLPNLCNPENPTFSNLSLTINGGVAEVAIGQGERAQLLIGREGRLLLTVGNIPRRFSLDICHYSQGYIIFTMPAGFMITEDTDPFRFLLSAGSPGGSPPPGLSGCVRDVIAGGERLLLTDFTSMEHLQIGVCPSA